MQKKIFLFALLVLAGVSLFAQSSVRQVYAYSREMIPGNIPRFEEDSMKKAYPPVRQKEYFIYVEVRKNVSVRVDYVYADGKYYTASLEKLNSPVRISQGASEITLVKATKYIVYRVNLFNETVSWNGKRSAERTRKKSPVLVCLFIAGKRYYGKTDKIKILEPFEGI